MVQGDVVLVKFPFTNLKSTKKRPALLLKVIHLSKTVDLCLIAMITSKLDGLDLNGDILLRDWELSNLLHPSLVKLSKVATIESELIEKKLGSLSAADQELVRASFQSFFAFWMK